MTITTSDYGRYIDEMLEIELKMKQLAEDELREISEPGLRKKLEEIHREEIRHISTLKGIKEEILQFNRPK